MFYVGNLRQFNPLFIWKRYSAATHASLCLASLQSPVLLLRWIRKKRKHHMHKSSKTTIMISVTWNYCLSKNSQDVLILPFFIQSIVWSYSTPHHPTYLFSLPARLALNCPAAKKMQQLLEHLCIIQLSEAIMFHYIWLFRKEGEAVLPVDQDTYNISRYLQQH